MMERKTASVFFVLAALILLAAPLGGCSMQRTAAEPAAPVSPAVTVGTAAPAESPEAAAEAELPPAT